MLLTPQRVAAIYDCLRQFHPFDKWKLPPSDEVEFSVTGRKDVAGVFDRMYRQPLKGHKITISYLKHNHFDSIVRTVAHEMVHQAQEIAGMATTSQHNEDFLQRAKKVCSSMGWDAGQF